jgi:hypothetical protein
MYKDLTSDLPSCMNNKTGKTYMKQHTEKNCDPHEKKKN